MLISNMKAPVLTLLLLALCSQFLATATTSTTENVGDDEEDDISTNTHSSGDKPNGSSGSVPGDRIQTKRKKKQRHGKKKSKASLRMFVSECKSWKPEVNVTTDPKGKSLVVDFCHESNPANIPETLIDVYHYRNKTLVNRSFIVTTKCRNKFDHSTANCYIVTLRVSCPGCQRSKDLGLPCEYHKKQTKKVCIPDDTVIPSNRENEMVNTTSAAMINTLKQEGAPDKHLIWIIIAMAIALASTVVGILAYKMYKRYNRSKPTSPSEPQTIDGQPSSSSQLLAFRFTPPDNLSFVTIETFNDRQEFDHSSGSEGSPSRCQQTPNRQNSQREIERERLLQNPSGQTSNLGNSSPETDELDTPGITGPDEKGEVYFGNQPVIPIPYELLGLQRLSYENKLYHPANNVTDTEMPKHSMCTTKI